MSKDTPKMGNVPVEETSFHNVIPDFNDPLI